MSDLYGSTRRFNGKTYSLEGTAPLDQLSAAVAVRQANIVEGIPTRITSVGKRGVKDADGNRRKNCFAIWACYE